MKYRESCKTCRFLVKIMCHPWNNAIGRGKMTNKLGWGCACPFVMDVGSVVFMDTTIHACECWEYQEQSK